MSTNTQPTSQDSPGSVSRPPALVYNLTSLWRTCILPRFVRRLQRRLCLRGWERRPDADEIRRRVDYYNPLRSPFTPGEDSRPIADIKLKDSHSAYWYDLMRYLRAYPTQSRVDFIDGDTWSNPDHPVFAKARCLDSKAGHCALLRLDSRRHFMKVDDRIPFEQKKDILLFRGEIYGKPSRLKFFEMWADEEGFDLGDTSRRNPSKWYKPPMSIPLHFHCKYILALEGNDVASSLQWICSSNCIPVMPRPTKESWLMHGAMIPGKHYIEIRPDFSDVKEKIAYYNAHPEEARAISEASKEWMRQFSDPRRENIISYLVADRYIGNIRLTPISGAKSGEDEKIAIP
ncbi:MAG: lipopolysaccharide biosynthesis protein [Muribaculaceae bacterium]|nr:lipopolysaccharide biosynthesis protein [Muribaculaceae bacterium]